MPDTLVSIEDLKKERLNATLRLARANRSGATEEERALAGRDFAYIKAKLMLAELIQDYPPMSDAQRLEITRMVGS